jgi:hypothetical protein
VHVVVVDARRGFVVTGVKIDGVFVDDGCGVCGEFMADDGVGRRHFFS